MIVRRVGTAAAASTLIRSRVRWSAASSTRVQWTRTAGFASSTLAAATTRSSRRPTTRAIGASLAAAASATVAALTSDWTDVPQATDAQDGAREFRDEWLSTVRHIQQEVCDAVERIDGDAKFVEDRWERPEGGGGWTRVLTDGKVFEKAGVNVSAIHGQLPPEGQRQLRSRGHSLPTASPNSSVGFWACGVSLVLHPKNPMAPTVHANYRFIEVMVDASPNAPAGGTRRSSIWWFGGGADLTPTYLFEEDAVEFHRAHKRACDSHDASFYPRFKLWCDKYFYLPHRSESRGVGGIFFDDVDAVASVDSGSVDGGNEHRRKRALRDFAASCGRALLEAYVPIMERRKDLSFTPEQKRWQQLRRGRYVEFNLAIDRGTKFGLETPGSRIESVLVSLPLTARWEYNPAPPPAGSAEAALVEALRRPRDWLGLGPGVA